jgi:hypothetical protein
MAIVIGEWDLQPAPPPASTPAVPGPAGEPPAGKLVKPHHVELGIRQLEIRCARVRAH